MNVKGRDAKNGVPRELTLLSSEVYEVLRRPARQIADEVLSVLEETSPELVSDISENGITLTGGGGLLRGLDERLRKEIGIPVHVSETALINVVEGCAAVLESPDFLAQGTQGVGQRR